MTSNRNGKREMSTTLKFRCFNCQQLGHKERKGKKICCKCWGEHDYGECGDIFGPKCCYCGGSHSGAYFGCIAQKQAMKYKSVHNVSYA